MTLSEGKKKVYMLLDEYSSGGVVTEDEDIENKMASFFDMAQKELARIVPIVKVAEIEQEPGVTEYAMPEDFWKLKKIWRSGRAYRGYRWKAGKLIIPETETQPVEVEYFANPAQITENTPENYVFEVSDNAAQAMPFYVAAQQLIVDLVMDYSAPWAMWMQMKQDLINSGTGERATLTNVLFR